MEEKVEQLFTAIDEGRVEAVEELLAEGVDPSAKNRYGALPLRRAAQKGDARIVGALARAGAEGSDFALGELAERGHEAAVEALLAAKADPNAPGVNGFTPLIFAIAGKYPGVVSALLKGGADPNLSLGKEQGDRTPLMVAAEQSTPEIVATLLEAGADVSLKDAWGQTAVPAATRNPDDTLDVLIERYESVDERDRDGESALFMASANGRVRAVRRLVEASADVNLQNNAGGTVLMAAAFAGEPGLVELLLELGADPKLQDAKGRTAADMTRLPGRGVKESSREGVYMKSIVLESQFEKIRAVLAKAGRGGGLRKWFSRARLGS